MLPDARLAERMAAEPAGRPVRDDAQGRVLVVALGHAGPAAAVPHAREGVRGRALPEVAGEPDAQPVAGEPGVTAPGAQPAEAEQGALQGEAGPVVLRAAARGVPEARDGPAVPCAVVPRSPAAQPEPAPAESRKGPHWRDRHSPSYWSPSRLRPQKARLRRTGTYPPSIAGVFCAYSVFPRWGEIRTQWYRDAGGPVSRLHVHTVAGS